MEEKGRTHAGSACVGRGPYRHAVTYVKSILFTSPYPQGIPLYHSSLPVYIFLLSLLSLLVTLNPLSISDCHENTEPRSKSR